MPRQYMMKYYILSENWNCSPLWSLAYLWHVLVMLFRIASITPLTASIFWIDWNLLNAFLVMNAEVQEMSNQS